MRRNDKTYWSINLEEMTEAGITFGYGNFLTVVMNFKLYCCIVSSTRNHFFS